MEGKTAEPGEQVGDHPATVQRLARGSGQHLLAIARRLQEARMRKAHRDIAEADRGGHGLVLRLGSEALVDRQPGELLRLGKIGEQLVLGHRLRRKAGDQHIDALVDLGQLDIA